MSDSRCDAEHPERPDVRCQLSGDRAAHDAHFWQSFEIGNRDDTDIWPNPDFVSPEQRREERKRRERLEKERLRRVEFLVRRDRRLGDEGPSRLHHLETCADDHLAAYCSSRGPYPWWTFARPGVAEALDPADVLAVQLLGAKIRPAIVIQMFSDNGNCPAPLISVHFLC